MTRKCQDWLTSFLEYTAFGEAPKHVYFWTGVSTIAGALRRRVWVDMGSFDWTPNFYILLVARPGIVSKSTTISIGMNLLKEIKTVTFGPNITTWQALVPAFAEAAETVEIDGTHHPFSALTIESSELGNLIDPQDRRMIDLFITLWDSQNIALTKHSKLNGKEQIVNPTLNLIACTTPSWIADNLPMRMIGGGFTSRVLFVYADQKVNYNAYPIKEFGARRQALKQDLIHDLEEISRMAGQMHLTPAAISWGEAWYKKHYEDMPAQLTDERFAGYIARKQTHLHKLGIILAASRNSMKIDVEDLETGLAMLTDLEPDMLKVFSGMGRKEAATHADKLLAHMAKRGGTIPYAEGYRMMHPFFPSGRELEDFFAGLLRTRQIRATQIGSVPALQLETLSTKKPTLPPS